MIYEYSCPDCKTRVDVSKPLADMEKPETCAVCKKEMTRLISRTSFQLKGSGWFKDGYSKPSISFGGKRVAYDSSKVPNK